MPEFDGKVAIVTGAGRLRGIGRGAAIAFAELGADVVVTGTGRDPSRYPDDEKAVGWRDVESTAEQVRALGVRALPLVVDVTNEDAVQMMVDRTLEEFGRVDFLVNNAAWARGPDRVSLFDLDPGILQNVLDVKIYGGFYCSRAVGRVLLEQGEGGAIVFVSSTSGKRGGANGLAYNAACFAQVGMTQSLADEPGATRHKRELRLSGGGGHGSRRRHWAWGGVGGYRGPDADAQDRHRRGARRRNRLPMHRGCLVHSGSGHQRQRRYDNGALTPRSHPFVGRSRVALPMMRRVPCGSCRKTSHSRPAASDLSVTIPLRVCTTS